MQTGGPRTVLECVAAILQRDLRGVQYGSLGVGRVHLWIGVCPWRRVCPGRTVCPWRRVCRHQNVNVSGILHQHLMRRSLDWKLASQTEAFSTFSLDIKGDSKSPFFIMLAER